MKREITIKSNKFRFIYDNCVDNIRHTTTNNIEIRQYKKKKKIIVKDGRNNIENKFEQLLIANEDI